jgi:nitroimidazol reductase NimA-like FMN-containing flavoprotein (pyridoxamine 5'-phosphate oxidase superfamily)
MSDLPVRKQSAWSAPQIEQYLSHSKIPLRISCNAEDGFPLVCSIWYVYHDGFLWGATHESAKLAKLLAADNKCAFEVAPNDMPYKGVRGQGTVELIRAEAGEVLGELLERYLGSADSDLGQWLLSRSDHEYAIKIRPNWLTSWDYSERMAG